MTPMYSNDMLLCGVAWLHLALLSVPALIFMFRMEWQDLKGHFPRTIYWHYHAPWHARHT